MYAVVRAGSFQYKVSEGDVIEIPLLEENEKKSLHMDVLLFDDGKDIRVGQPLLKDVKVTAKIEENVSLGEKLMSFKRRPRKNFNWRKGHRQKHTVVSITKIEAGK